MFVRSFVRPFVRPVLVCLELLICIFWHQILHDDFRMTSSFSLRSVEGQSQVSLCLKSEPKILCLVIFCQDPSSRYTMSLRDKVILERTATKVFTDSGYGDDYLKIGTDELDGNDYGESNWYNMGEWNMKLIVRFDINQSFVKVNI